MSIIGKQYMGRVNLAGEAQAVDNNPTTVLTRDETTGDVKLTPVSFFPSDSDVDGLNLAVNQAAATLMLRNAANNVLSTVNLGFLNNEGTTFFYNSTTKELELRNDDGELLSSIPVSAFVSNLIQSVNFNSGTPYRLEFKDASGDVVDFVDINVLNVQGAAVDADVLHKTGNETKTGNLSIIGDLGIANNRAIGVGDGLYFFYSSATQKTMLNRPADDLNFMTFDAVSGNIIVGGSTDTGEKLQVTGTTRINVGALDLGLRVGNGAIPPFSVYGDGTVNCFNFNATKGQVATAPVDPTDVVRLQDLGIKTTASTSSTVVVNPNTATSYRLNAGVTSVTLPPLTNNEGKILFLINASGNSLMINSNSGGNDILSGDDAVSTYMVDEGQHTRILHDGTTWTVL